MMYNEEMKSRFISEHITSASARKMVKSIFNNTSKYEERYGVDVCQMSEKQLTEMLEEATMRAATQTTWVSYLRIYCKWCVRNSFPEATLGIENIDNVVPNRIKNGMVANPTHLQRCLDNIFEVEDADTTDNVYRCYLWLAYAGLNKEDTMRVRVSDVDFDNMVVRFEGEEYPIYREGIKNFRKCIELDSFRVEHPNYKCGFGFKKRAINPYLLRAVNDEMILKRYDTMSERRNRQYREKLGDAVDGFIVSLSYSKLKLSGIFYRIYQRELAGYDVSKDLSQYALDSTISGNRQLKKNNAAVYSREKRLNQHIHTDYENWKITFVK